MSSYILLLGMISGDSHSGVQTRFAQTGGPRAEWKSPSIMLMNLIKRLKSMAMIYILPAPAKPLVILHRPSGKSANKTVKKRGNDSYTVRL